MTVANARKQYLTYFLALALSLSSLCGCVVRSKPMLNPATGEQVTCAERGLGVLSSSLAYAKSVACEQEHSKRGFLPIDEFEKLNRPFIRTLEPSQPALYPGKRIGSWWRYRFRNGESIVTERIQAAGNDLLITSDNGRRELRDSFWAIKYITEKNGKHQVFYPPLQSFNWPLSLGSTWESKSEILEMSGTKTETIEFAVAGYGLVRLPAGEFEAYLITGKTLDGRKKSEEWYAPAIQGVVKKVYYLEPGIERYELHSFSN